LVPKTQCFQCAGNSDGVAFFPNGCQVNEQGSIVTTSFPKVACVELITGKSETLNS